MGACTGMWQHRALGHAEMHAAASSGSSSSIGRRQQQQRRQHHEAAAVAAAAVGMAAAAAAAAAGEVRVPGSDHGVSAAVGSCWAGVAAESRVASGLGFSAGTPAALQEIGRRQHVAELWHWAAAGRSALPIAHAVLQQSSWGSLSPTGIASSHPTVLVVRPAASGPLLKPRRH